MIAPITGKLRKRFFVDLTSALGLGTAAAYAWWYGYHLKSVARQEQYYLKLEQEKLGQK
ncbi:cytochrome-c oxidase, subunit VIIa [Marasmius fiardii PR-910]|nr:cytochrome-c oxidase, subunit VIIa [Marasmius fiardii PR-910]